MTGVLTYEQAVSAWATHLRTGGTTPWRVWQADASADLPVTRPLPDALHLELVRRINLAARGDTGAHGDLRGLADRVFATAAPGRGLLDVPLPWPPAPRPFGTPAIDPEQLPAEELVRLAVGVLGHLLPGVPRPAPEQLPSRWPLPWRRRFRLHGAPATAAAIRRSLLAQGYVESDWRPTHVVIARPVEVMMAEHWSAVVRRGGILKWNTTWRRAEAAGRLPSSIDVTAIANSLQGRRREPVHVVVAREAEHAAELAAGVLLARPAEIRGSGDAAVSDLLRRLNRFSALTHGPVRVRDLARTLVSVLDEEEVASADVEATVTPPASLPWALAVAATSAGQLRSAGYAVHGDPDALSPTEHQLPGTVDRERTLELAVTACVRTWHLGGDP
ncbi:MAG: hypothetical protein ABIR34_12895 [Marmoricola sp.]